MAWDPPTDDEAAGYVLWYGTAPKTYTKSIDVGLTLSYTVKNLLAGTGYCFAVRAYDEDRTMSDLSTEVCGNTLGTPPPPVDDGAVDVDPLPVGSKEIVVYASKGTPRGNWVASTSTGAAEGRSMRSADKGWSATNAPLASPTNYFELKFDAAAATPYRVWLRLRAAGDSKWNDAVWVQFSSAFVNGKTAYQIGTTSGLLVNLERCDACGVRGWGWTNSAYWLAQNSVVTFAKAGPQTMRIQIREDGVEVDQVVLSAARFFSSPPGPSTSDATILAPTATSTPPPTTPALTTPYGGKPVAIPGIIEATRFDNGAAGAAFFDSTAGNTGGVFRNTDVDMQRASDGGYNVAWTTAGEWLLYTINVTRAATYTAYVQVASTSTGTIELSAGAPSNTTKVISVPNTGGSQKWVVVRVPITLAVGVQTLKVRVTSGSPNLRKIEIR